MDGRVSGKVISGILNGDTSKIEIVEHYETLAGTVITDKTITLNPSLYEFAIVGTIRSLGAGGSTASAYSSISGNPQIDEIVVTGKGANSEAGGYGKVAVIFPDKDIVTVTGGEGGTNWGSAFMIKFRSKNKLQIKKHYQTTTNTVISDKAIILYPQLSDICIAGKFIKGGAGSNAVKGYHAIAEENHLTHDYHITGKGANTEGTGVGTVNVIIPSGGITAVSGAIAGTSWDSAFMILIGKEK